MLPRPRRAGRSCGPRAGGPRCPPSPAARCLSLQTARPRARRERLPHRRRYRRHVHRYRSPRRGWCRRDAEGLLQRRRLCAGHHGGGRLTRRRARHRRRRYRRGGARDDGRQQRAAGAQGRAHRADRHARLPRRAGDPQLADAPALRPRVGEAAAARRALPARRGGRADRCGGQCAEGAGYRGWQALR